jgi:UDP-3-O-[3-hydroxymyristoyl] glucosamine N-acyltransferase
VTLYPRVRLGRRAIVHSGAVLGADGFGFAKSPEGALKIPQVGGVLIGDDVEIGANTTIDRATLGDTKVGRGTKIDNLVMIGHNVEIGEHCLIVAQVGIAGSAKLGNGVIVAGQAGLVGHIEVGDGVTIAAQSGVANDLEDGRTYLGAPARELGEAKRILACMARMPEWARRLKALEEKVAGGQAE